MVAVHQGNMPLFGWIVEKKTCKLNPSWFTDSLQTALLLSADALDYTAIISRKRHQALTVVIQVKGSKSVVYGLGRASWYPLVATRSSMATKPVAHPALY